MMAQGFMQGSIYRLREPLSWQRIYAIALSIAAHIALLALVVAYLPTDEIPAFDITDEALPVEFIMPVNQVNPPRSHPKRAEQKVQSTPSVKQVAQKMLPGLPSKIWNETASPAVPSNTPSQEMIGANNAMTLTVSGLVSGPSSAGNANVSGGNGETYGDDGSIEILRLKAKHSPSPDYPAISSRNAEQGVVVLLVKVGADGIPVEARILKSSGFARLDETTKKNILARWQFYPAMRNGMPIPAYILAKQVFVMEGRIH
jgi:TonB family protein